VKRHELVDGDVIQLGEHKLLYRDLRRTHLVAHQMQEEDDADDDEDDEDEDEDDFDDEESDGEDEFDEKPEKASRK
jgi:hypothetical protein